RVLLVHAHGALAVEASVGWVERSVTRGQYSTRMAVTLHFTLGSGCLCDIDDEAEPERGEGGFDLLHLRGVARIEDAVDLRQMPAQASRQFGASDFLLSHRVVKRGFRHPERRQRDHHFAALCR